MLGILLDGPLKNFKITTLCVISFLSASSFVFIQYHYKRIYYFITVSIIGLSLGSAFNYTACVGAKLLLENKQVKATQINLGAMLGLIETITCLMIFVNFYVIPYIIDHLFLVLSTQIAFIGFICLFQIKDEFRYNRNIVNRTIDHDENSTLINN